MTAAIHRDAIDVSIVIVSYNTAAMTVAAISSVVAETRDVSYELIVVDNASRDGSAEAISDHPAAPRLIALDTNIGFARANNLAVSEARGRYILLLNPDTLVTAGAIDRIVHFADRNPFAKLWGGRTIFADGSLNRASCWKRMTVWNQFCRGTGLTGLFHGSSLFNAEAMAGWQRDSVRRVDIVSGCFLLIERSFWDQLGGFDPQFFMYGEDADLCLRARKAGARPLITPDATIVHYGGASETVASDKMVRLLTAKSMLVERHWPRLTRPLGRALLAAWPLGRWLSHTLAAHVLNRHRHSAQAQNWASVWQRRNLWLKGYDANHDTPSKLNAQPSTQPHTRTPGDEVCA